MSSKILLIEDDDASRFAFSRYLSKAGYLTREADCLSEAREAIASRRFDAVLLDLKLPDGNGLDWIPELREHHPDMPVIVVTAFGDIPLAVEAMRRGADNFLTKPVNMEDLEVFLRKSLELGTLRRRYSTYQRLKRTDEIYFGESPAMKEVMKLASLAAETDSPVLISGETGSGKGILARWLHDNSLRSSASFVDLNCSNLKGDLLASELFGHVKGAFTNALRDREGLIEVADGGSLFLDEISDMDPGVQAQFLKVIEDRQYRRIGEVRVRQSEFRLICATNRDILTETHQGRFRKDLYFRINVLSIPVPSLRERTADIPGLVSHMLRNIGAANCAISPGVMKLLQDYSWPGNVRELRNMLERALLLAHGQPLSAEHFHGLDASQILNEGRKPINDLEDVESAHIHTVVRELGGDTKKAAEQLNISRATLYRKLKKSRDKL